MGLCQLFKTSNKANIMRSNVTIIFSAKEQLTYESHIPADQVNADEARQWLIDKWTELECEPIRQSGKVLLSDRILGIADQIGYHWMNEHPENAAIFAEKCSIALDSEVVKIDIPGGSITSA